MKKRDLKNAYGEVPQSFHNSVVRTLNTLDTDTAVTVQHFADFDEERILNVQPRKRSVFKTVTACVLAAAIVTVGAVSAKAVFPMVATKEGNYGLNIDIEPGAGGQASAGESNISGKTELMKLAASKSAPEYVKMTVGYLPEGVIEDQGKYSLNGNHKEKCFAIIGERIVEKKTLEEDNIVDYEEFDLNGNRAILAASATGSKRFFIYFENEAVLISAYVTSDVSDEKIKKVMENITIEECSAEESNISSLTEEKEYLKEQRKEEKQQALYDLFVHDDVYNYHEIKTGQKLSFKGDLMDGKNLNFSVDNIEILDNISDLDYNNFESTIAEEYLPTLTDENGNFVPREREYYISGDGITAPRGQVSRTDTVMPKMVYVTLTVNNPTDSDDEFVFQGFEADTLSAEALKNGVTIDYKSEDNDVSEYTIPILSTEVHYIDNNNVDKDGYKQGYNFLDVAANSTETIHIGFIVDEDKLDNTYVTIDECWNASAVFDPEQSAFVENNKDYYHSLPCVKVQ